MSDVRQGQPGHGQLPPATRLLLVGPDGCGKSTLSAAIAAHERVTPLHFRGRTRRAAAAMTPLDAGPPRGFLAGLLKSLIVIAEWHWAFLRFRYFSRTTLLVAERSYADMLVDPGRYRLVASLVPVLRRLCLLAPHFDLAVLLTGDPVEIVRRKPELEVAEVARQLAAWQLEGHRVARRVMVLDTTAHDVQQVLIEILRAVSAHGRPS